MWLTFLCVKGDKISKLLKYQMDMQVGIKIIICDAAGSIHGGTGGLRVPYFPVPCFPLSIPPYSLAPLIEKTLHCRD